MTWLVVLLIAVPVVLLVLWLLIVAERRHDAANCPVCNSTDGLL